MNLSVMLNTGCWGLSYPENSLYQMAIEEFLSKAEAAEFYEKLLKRVISSQDKKKLLKKLKSNKRAPLYPEDEVD